MSGIWSTELASILPGTPVREADVVVSDQPRSAVSKSTPDTSPLWKEMTYHFTELDLLLEYKMLSEDPVPGIFVLPSTKTLLEWHGIIFLHNGPWKGGMFHFTLYIPDGFPQMRPMVRFRSDVFHPYIHSNNGVMNMSRTVPFWKPKQSHIRDVIVAIRDCFLREECWSTDNKDEEKLMKDKIRACVVQSTMDSKHNEDPDNVFNFSNDDQMIKKARQLVHQRELPQLDKGDTTPGIIDKLTAQVGRLFDTYWST